MCCKDIQSSIFFKAKNREKINLNREKINLIPRKILKNLCKSSNYIFPAINNAHYMITIVIHYYEVATKQRMLHH